MSSDWYKARIFSNRNETINLALPVIFLVMIAVEYFWGESLIKNLTFFQSTFLVDVIFLNILHNAFTVTILCSGGEFEVWLNENGGKKKFWISQLAYLLGMSMFFCVSFSLSLQSGSYALVMGLIFYLIPAHHAMSQSFGLSLAYNLLGSSHSLGSSIIKWKRNMYSIFLASNLLIGIIIVLTMQNTSSDFVFFSSFLSGISGALLLIISLPLVLISFFEVGNRGIAQGVFSLRFLIWPLVFVSPVAIFATKAVHGIEYYCVADKVIGPKKNWLKSASCCIARRIAACNI